MFSCWPGFSPGVTGRPTGWPGSNRPLDWCQPGPCTVRHRSVPVMARSQARFGPAGSGLWPGRTGSHARRPGALPGRPALTPGVPVPCPVDQPSHQAARSVARSTSSYARRPGLRPGLARLKPGCTKISQICSQRLYLPLGYKRGFFPNSYLGFLSKFLTTIVEPLELASSPFPPMILAYSWGI
jgi:hypothetical protein